MQNVFNYNVEYSLPPKVDMVVFANELPAEEDQIEAHKVYLIVTKTVDGYMWINKQWVQVVQDSVPLCDLSDYWIPTMDELIFRHIKGAIILPVSDFYKMEPNPNLDYFVLSIKRCYNNDKVRNHCCHYLNYFEKYYDQDHTLLMIYFKLKYLIDYVPGYTEKDLLSDLKKYLFGPEIRMKARQMNLRNYDLVLLYRNNNNPGLQYNDRHGKIFMEISLLMNMCIPLITHFAYVKKIVGVSQFLLKIFDTIFNLYDSVDVYSKLYETSNSNVRKSHDEHEALWEMQSIRGMNSTTHSICMVNNIIMQIMPKYTYDKNIILFNYSSIMKNLGYQVVEIAYEFDYKSLSSSKRDDDNNSEFDKFESRLIKQDEAMYLQTKVNYEDTMDKIELLFGPFDDDEINFYYRALEENGTIVNDFQKTLVFNLFDQYFGDPESLKAINATQYIELLLSSKKLLEGHGLVILPYIISGKVERLITRKMISKKEMLKIEDSPYYRMLQDKYKNDKIIKYILSIIAVMLSSEFKIIDYHNPEINGKKIDIIPEFILEEVLMYALLI